MTLSEYRSDRVVILPTLGKLHFCSCQLGIVSVESCDNDCRTDLTEPLKCAVMIARSTQPSIPPGVVAVDCS